MVADELTLAARRIMEAREPEDVFGVEGDDRDARRAAAKRAYRRLARIVHPDARGDAVGQNVLMLDDAETVCEVIALAVGLGEGTVDLAGGLDDLREAGTDERAIEATSKALATVGAGVGPAALGETDGNLDVGDEPGAERL